MLKGLFNNTIDTEKSPSWIELTNKCILRRARPVVGVAPAVATLAN